MFKSTVVIANELGDTVVIGNVSGCYTYVASLDHKIKFEVSLQHPQIYC